MYRKHHQQMVNSGLSNKQPLRFGLLPIRLMLWFVVISIALSSTFVLYTTVFNVNLESIRISFEYDANATEAALTDDTNYFDTTKRLLLERVELVRGNNEDLKLEKFNLLFIDETSTQRVDQIDPSTATTTTSATTTTKLAATMTAATTNVTEHHPHNKLVDDGTAAMNETRWETILPVLVIACNRISVKRSLDQLIAFRSSKDTHPIIVSQDCGHNETREAINSYGDQLQLIEHNNSSEVNLPFKLKKFVGYYKIARHYSWALNYVFNRLNYDAVIIIEDDLDISPDLLDYFRALYPILKADETLYCISAWNDNGKGKFIDETKTDLLYRTDFFPGLGWMLTNKTYQEFSNRWPSTFWDDWMRHPDQRRNRACIRPEVPRTKTFGKIGVSNGQYYEDHLKYFSLNDQYVQFTKLNLTYLLKENYDRKFLHDVYSSETITVSELLASHPDNATTSINRQKIPILPKRIDYSNTSEFKTIAKKLGLMPDIKAGVARTAYFGIVTIFFKNQRIFIAPPRNWTHYDENAS